MSVNNEGLAFTTEASVLSKVLTRMASVVERRNTIPIISNVLLQVSGGKLTITATDLEMRMTESVPAIEMVDGEITVSASVLRGIAASLPAPGRVQIESSKDGVSVLCGDFSAQIFALPACGFPEFKAPEFTHEFKVPAPQLKRLFDRVKHAMSTEETRYYLNGVYLHTAPDGVLKAVATDGHRLAVSSATGIAGINGFPGIINPKKTVKILLNLLMGVNADVTISATDAGERIKFQVGPICLMSKHIDGTYPDYGRVIPRGNDRILAVEKNVFLNALACVDAVKYGTHSAIKLSLLSDSVTLSTHSPDKETAQHKLNRTTKYTGPAMEIGFQAQYLRATLALAGDDIVFLFADSAAPAVMQSSPDDDVINVLMPMRI